MLSATIGRRKRQIPESWNELSPRQLLAVALVHGQAFDRLAQQQDALLRILLDVSGRVFRRINIVQRVELRPLTRFLQGPDNAAPFTAQLLPVLRLPWYCRPLLQAYHGPRENFRNLRFDEFIFADTYFLRYLKTNDETVLDQFVAVLYRPQRAGYAPLAPDYGGDRREDFNEHLLAARARVFSRLPHHVKWAVLLWYRGCRHGLEQRFPYVFTEGNTKQAASSGWSEVLHELAGGVHQLDATAQQLLPSVLREMNRILRRQEEREAHS